MARRVRPLALVAAGLSVAAAAVAAWPWLSRLVVTPAAMALWLLARLTVLAVDQRVWWLALICAVPLAFLRSALAHPAPGGELTVPLRRTPHPIARWRAMVQRTASGLSEPVFYRWSAFVELLVLHAALERRADPDHRVHEALRTGAQPLPPRVHAFAFPPPPPPRARGPRGLLERAGALPRRWRWSFSGRALAERQEAMAELLSYLEARLELTSDDERTGSDLR